MRDYLLDTNIWSDWYDPAKNGYILDRLKNKTGARLHISVITWGELRYGYNVLTTNEKKGLGDPCIFVSGKSPVTIVIDRHVSNIYGEVRAALFDKYAPRPLRKKGMRPEQLTDPCTSLELQIQENDLWLVAQAINNEFTLVTNDKKMKPIWDIVREVTDNDLAVDIWNE